MSFHTSTLTHKPSKNHAFTPFLPLISPITITTKFNTVPHSSLRYLSLSYTPIHTTTITHACRRPFILTPYLLLPPSPLPPITSIPAHSMVSSHPYSCIGFVVMCVCVKRGYTNAVIFSSCLVFLSPC